MHQNAKSVYQHPKYPNQFLILFPRHISMTIPHDGQPDFKGFMDYINLKENYSDLKDINQALKIAGATKRPKAMWQFHK